MRDMIKSAIYVDFDNVFISLQNLDPGCENLFVEYADDWLKLLEAGEDGGPQRNFLIKHCYMNSNMNQYSVRMKRGGFDTITCPSLTHEGKSAADIQMAVDVTRKVYQAVDQVRIDEFIVFSADADFTPVVKELRSNGREVTILELGNISGAYRNAAHRIIGNLPQILRLAARHDVSGDAPPAPAPDGTAPAHRHGPPEAWDASAAPAPADPVYALAERVHELTGTPLLDPRDYAVLFKRSAEALHEYGVPNEWCELAEQVRLDDRVSPDDVRFVLRGLDLSRYRCGSGETAQSLANAFLKSVLHRCYTLGGFRPAADQRLMLEQWLCSVSQGAITPALRAAGENAAVRARCIALVKQAATGREDGVMLSDLGILIREEMPGLYTPGRAEGKWFGHSTLTRMLLSFDIKPLVIAPIDEKMSIVYDPATPCGWRSAKTQCEIRLQSGCNTPEHRCCLRTCTAVYSPRWIG